MKFAVGLLVLIAFASVSAYSCTNPDPESCSFYLDCVEKERPCGENGYAIGYGHKYCEIFRKHDPSDFSDMGNQWMTKVRPCLQQVLVEKIKKNELKNMECDVITDFAFNSHPKCYTEVSPSFCDLPFGDQTMVARYIEVKDIFSWRTIKQMKDVAKICLFNSNLESSSSAEELPMKIKFLKQLAAVDNTEQFSLLAQGLSSKPNLKRAEPEIV